MPYDDIFNIPSGELAQVFAQRVHQADMQVHLLNRRGDLPLLLKNELQKQNLHRLWLSPEQHELRSFLEKDFQIADNLLEAQVSITGCRALIARTGSIVLDAQYGRRAGLWNPVHFVIATQDQLYSDLSAFFAEMSEPDTSAISIITGVSRTADIEKKLVKGAHGPHQVQIFLIP